MTYAQEGIIKAIKKSGNGEILLARVNYFAILFQELGFTKYKEFFHNLQNKVAVEAHCSVFEAGHNIFFIISKSAVKGLVEKIVYQYALDNGIYLSVHINRIGLKAEESIQDLDELKYNMLANLDINDHSKDIKKIHSLYCATHQKKLSVALQPVVDRNYQIYFYESLLRTDSNLFSSPAEIVSIAEQMNFTTVLDMQVLDMVVALIKKDPNLMLSMNISCNSIEDRSWSKQFIETVNKQGISNNLIIEITETGSKRNYTKIVKFIGELHNINIKVAMDDFGSGYTSFVQLQSFKIDFIKIDGFFIQNIIYNKSSVIFVRTIIEMAHSLGIKVIAESVESEEVAKLLIEFGTDYLQGYYFGRPNKV